MSSVAVIGAGAWGTALAIQAARAGCAVTLVPRDARRATEIAESRTSARLPGATLPLSVSLALSVPPGVDAVLLAPPLQHLRAVVGTLAENGPPLVVCAKGIEAENALLPLEIVAQTRPERQAVFLTGPNFAGEVAAGLPTATVLACGDPALRQRLMALLATPGFRVYGNDDPIGAQVGGAAKNVVAIAAGAVMGAGLGENARAALITRGLAELARAAVALGGRAETVMGLSGLGDLLLTCTGPSSRNYSLGFALGRGERLADVLAARTAVTEGVATAPALLTRLRGVDMPVCRAVASLLGGTATLDAAITALLARPPRDE